MLAFFHDLPGIYQNLPKSLIGRPPNDLAHYGGLQKIWKIHSERSEIVLTEAAFSACRAATSNMVMPADRLQDVGMILSQAGAALIGRVHDVLAKMTLPVCHLSLPRLANSSPDRAIYGRKDLRGKRN